MPGQSVQAHCAADYAQFLLFYGSLET